MEKENLHLLITEEIYMLPQDETSNESEEEVSVEHEVVVETEEEVSIEQEAIVESVEEVSAKQELVHEPASENSKKEETVETTESNEVQDPEEKVAESPKIPKQETESIKEISFAVFHSSNDESDIELLNKIIAACKLPSDQYKIFDGGFDQSISFKKALVFVPEAKAFYSPIPYKNSEFLCSKPLDQISGDVQEKAKLWEALQKFVNQLNE
ncbi:hypothetical protein [Ekhidna sp.]